MHITNHMVCIINCTFYAFRNKALATKCIQIIALMAFICNTCNTCSSMAKAQAVNKLHNVYKIGTLSELLLVIWRLQAHIYLSRYMTELQNGVILLFFTMKQ